MENLVARMHSRTRGGSARVCVYPEAGNFSPDKSKRVGVGVSGALPEAPTAGCIEISGKRTWTNLRWSV